MYYVHNIVLEYKYVHVYSRRIKGKDKVYPRTGHEGPEGE
jgi:hypothetical protein